MFTSLLFANSLDDVEKDAQCFLNYGYRPISYGIDKYINSQGNFQDLGISTVNLRYFVNTKLSQD